MGIPPSLLSQITKQAIERYRKMFDTTIHFPTLTALNLLAFCIVGYLIKTIGSQVSYHLDVLSGTDPFQAWRVLNQQRTRAQLPQIEAWYNFDWRTQKPRELRPFKPIYNMSMGMFALKIDEATFSKGELTKDNSRYSE